MIIYWTRSFRVPEMITSVFLFWVNICIFFTWKTWFWHVPGIFLVKETALLCQISKLKRKFLQQAAAQKTICVKFCQKCNPYKDFFWFFWKQSTKEARTGFARFRRVACVGHQRWLEWTSSHQCTSSGWDPSSRFGDEPTTHPLPLEKKKMPRRKHLKQKGKKRS